MGNLVTKDVASYVIVVGNLAIVLIGLMNKPLNVYCVFNEAPARLCRKTPALPSY